MQPPSSNEMCMYIQSAMQQGDPIYLPSKISCSNTEDFWSLIKIFLHTAEL